MVEELEGSPIYHELSKIQGYWFDSLEELLEHQDDIICYTDCENMKVSLVIILKKQACLGKSRLTYRTILIIKHLVEIWK